MPTATVGTDYMQLLDAVKAYYGAGSDQWVEIARYGPAATDFANIIKQVPGVNVTVAKDGTYLGYSINQQVSTAGSTLTPGQAINSNTIGGTASQANTASVNIPASTGVNGSTGSATASSGVSRVYQAGQAVTSGLKFVTGEVLPAVAAVATGARLGKTIAGFFYNTWPGSDFWDNIGLSTMNPETWNSITSDYDGPTVLKSAFNTIFGLDPNSDNMQMYIDENALAYMALYLANNGWFQAATGERINEQTIGSYNVPACVSNYGCKYGPDTVDATIVFADNYTVEQSDILIPSGVSKVIIYAQKWNWWQSQGSYTYNGKTVYYYTYTNRNSGAYVYKTDAGSQIMVNPYGTYSSAVPLSVYAWASVYGDVSEIGGMEGVGTQPGATTPTTTGWTTPDNTKSSLQTQYPDLWNDRIEQDVLQPDGTIKTIVYVPVPMPDGVATPQQTGDTPNPQQPTSSGTTGTQANPEVNPNTATDSTKQTVIDILTSPTVEPSGQTEPTPTPTPGPDDDPGPSPSPDPSPNPTPNPQGNPLNPNDNPPDTGDGDSPTIITPTGGASALWSVYNPSQAEINSLGAWLWSSNFVDQLLKLFSNPMEAIIGLHKVFATPPVSGTGSIKVGYLDSGVSANLVSAQYTEVDCGTVNCFEYFGNVFDYDPHTKVNLYLPFIGIVPLNVADVMRGVVGVKYGVDVISGACLAKVSVTRDSAGGVLYTYGGDCSVRYPVSSGSYMSMVSGILSIAGGIAATVATGGAAAPAIMGAAAGVGRLHTDVQHSGTISGNSGAMGAKKPYLIISRPQTAMANDYQKLQGIGANSKQTVYNMTGFFKMDDVVLTNVTTATKEELEELRALLKTGVYK